MQFTTLYLELGVFQTFPEIKQKSILVEIKTRTAQYTHYHIYQGSRLTFCIGCTGAPNFFS